MQQIIESQQSMTIHGVTEAQSCLNFSTGLGADGFAL